MGWGGVRTADGGGRAAGAVTRGRVGEAGRVEHRYGSRTGVGTVVEIRCHDRKTLVGRVRNVGLGGMYIDLGREGLPLNLPVHLRFALETGGPPRPCAADGIVVHREPGGCGVMFSALDGDTLEALDGLLHGAGPASAAPP
jgi:hypothetical protein